MDTLRFRLESESGLHQETGAMQKSSGQATTEYALVAALVGVICLAGLVTLGTSMNQSWQAFGNGLTRKNVEPSVAGSGGAPTNLMAQTTGSLLGSTSPFSYASSVNKLSSTVMTTGASGATMLAADQLITRAKQLLAAGQITDAQADVMISMANQGHRIASIETLLDQAAAQSTSPAQYKAMQLTFDGKTYTPEQLTHLIGYDDGFGVSYYKTGNDTRMDGANDISGTNPETRAFMQLYQQATKNGSLADPVVADQVAVLSAQIIDLGEFANHSSMEIVTGRVQDPSTVNAANAHKTDMWVAANPKLTQLATASDKTNQNSGGICNAGGGSDAGTACQ